MDFAKGEVGWDTVERRADIRPSVLSARFVNHGGKTRLRRKRSGSATQGQFLETQESKKGKLVEGNLASKVTAVH